MVAYIINLSVSMGATYELEYCNNNSIAKGYSAEIPFRPETDISYHNYIQVM